MCSARHMHGAHCEMSHSNVYLTQLPLNAPLHALAGGAPHCPLSSCQIGQVYIYIWSSQGRRQDRNMPPPRRTPQPLKGKGNHSCYLLQRAANVPCPATCRMSSDAMLVILIFSHVSLANAITTPSCSHAHWCYRDQQTLCQGSTIFLYRTTQMMTIYAEERHSK